MYEVSRAVSNIGEMAVLMKDLQITEADVETFIEEWKQLALSFRDMAMAAAKEGYADILVDTLVAANYRRIVEDIGNDEELAEAIAEAEEVVSEEDKETLNEFIRL